jgi:hypothetical protein
MIAHEIEKLEQPPGYLSGYQGRFFSNRSRYEHKLRGKGQR